MTVNRPVDVKEIPTYEQGKRKAVVTQMLAERDRRQSVSQEEIGTMRGEGRY